MLQVVFWPTFLWLTSCPAAGKRAGHSVVRPFSVFARLDLEGIVAKRSLSPYTTERTTWFKIKNRSYSQMQGREELFERERHKEPVAGWHGCELACAEVAHG